MATGFMASKGRLAAAHHGQHAVLGTGLPPETGASMKCRPPGAPLELARHLGRGRGVVDEDGAGFMPAKAPGPSTTERRSSSLPTQANTSRRRRGLARRGGGGRRIRHPGLGLGGGAVVDGDLVAGAGQMAGHGIAHHAQAEKGHVAAGRGS
jgi:hypothetical protein